MIARIFNSNTCCCCITHNSELEYCTSISNPTKYYQKNSEVLRWPSAGDGERETDNAMRLNLNGALDDIDFQYLIYSLISVFNLFNFSLNINFISHQSQSQNQNLRSNERRFNILLFKLNIFLVVFRIFNFIFFLLYCHSQVGSPVLVLPTISKRLNVASVWMPTFRDVRMWHKKLENNYLTREFYLEYQIERRWKRMDLSWRNYVTIWCYTMGDLKRISFDFGEIWRTHSVIILRSEITSVRLVTPHFTR